MIYLCNKFLHCLQTNSAEHAAEGQFLHIYVAELAEERVRDTRSYAFDSLGSLLGPHHVCEAKPTIALLGDTRPRSSLDNGMH